MTDKTTAERWYMLNKDGMATLCADKPDAEQEAKKADATYPNCAPHRAVLMGEVGASLPLPGAQEAVATLALRMLVSADHITQEKADEAMSLAALCSKRNPPTGCPFPLRPSPSKDGESK